jgi:hypothetical protein
MTVEEKQLLLIDLSARLPYGVIIQHPDLFKPSVSVTEKLEEYYKGHFGSDGVDVEFVKPYLRSMSSMTEEEKEEYYETMDKYTHRIYPGSCDLSEHTEYSWTAETFDWLNKKMFDYRGLIPKGLAIEAPEGMYS